jgi:polyferredoxin
VLVTVIVRIDSENKDVRRKLQFKLNFKTKKELATALFALANFVGGSIVIGMAFGINAFALNSFLLGMIIIIVLYSAAVYIMEAK